MRGVPTGEPAGTWEAGPGPQSRTRVELLLERLDLAGGLGQCILRLGLAGHD
jgi:hypothetical protein